jgi:hypothetical protein
LPDAAEPLQRSQLLAALSVSNGIIQLRHIAPRFVLDSDVDAALEALAQGNSAIATARPARLDDRLASLPSAGSGASLALQARGSILAISEAHRACLLLQRRSAHVRFTEIDVFGVYIAPMSLMMVVAWLVTVALICATIASIAMRKNHPSVRQRCRRDCRTADHLISSVFRLVMD